MLNIKFVTRLSTTVAFVAAMGLASAEASGRPIILKMSGESGWEVSCTFERINDDPIEKRARGKRGVETIAVDDASGGSCTYEGPRRGAFQIRFTDENDLTKCPFRFVGEDCVGVFRSGESGSFDF